MFQHLDDPVPLPPSTPEQRRATLRRGAALRRRRRGVVAVVVAAVVAAVVGISGLAPQLRSDAEDPPFVASAAPSAEATAKVGPGRGTAIFWDSSPLVSATFDLPEGWGTDEGAISKLKAGEPFGLALFDVATIYTDGCRLRMVKPEPGPTVDDLVSAFTKVPGTEGAGRDVVVDGFHGTLVDYTVPPFKVARCVDGAVGILKSDSVPDKSPNLWAKPNQHLQFRVLDVRGTRLVIVTVFPLDASAEDRKELDTILASLRIS